MSILVLVTALMPTIQSSSIRSADRRQLRSAAMAEMATYSTADAPESFADQIEKSISKQEYQPSETARGVQAPNRAHNLRTYFEPWGVRVEDRTAEGGPELLRMRTAAVGRLGRSVPTVPGDVRLDGPRVENHHRGGIVEWYENTEAGLEHGYVLEQRPTGDGVLTIEVALEGADVAVRTTGATIVTAGGRRLEYGNLVAEDATGRAVRTWMEATEGGVRLRIDDDGAVYPLVIDPLLSSTLDATLQPDQADAQMGISVAGAGDVNGDGFADVIVGAYLYDAGETDEGAAFVFYGSASGIASGNPTTADAMLQSNQANAQMGISVAGAGDVNGDGYADVIVGAFFYSAGQSNEGAAFIFNGGPSGVASGDPTTANTTLQSDQGLSGLGVSVAGAGDVNGDGYADVIVGAYTFNSGQSNEGAAFVFHGGPSGVASGNPATANATLQSDQANANLGVSVAGAGDVNGDGFADVIVGAQAYDSGQTNEGAAFVFQGGASGVASGTPATANATLQADQAFALMGVSVAGAGDVNGDGYADVIVGAYFYDGSQTDEGAAFVFHGGSSGVMNGTPATANATILSGQASAQLGYSVAGAGDVNGDGYADVIVGAYQYDSGQTNEGAAFVIYGAPSGIPNASPATANAVLQSDQTNAQLGFAVAGTGDVNGDGYADVIVGAVTYDSGQMDEGAAFVSFGGAEGVRSGNPATANATLQADQADAQMGASVAGAGDVNGDGYADVIVGAWLYDAGQTNEGAAFVFHGGPSGIPSANPATANAMLQADQAGAFMGYTVSGAGDVNGDGYADVIVGALQYDSGQTNEGAAFIFHGGPSGISSGNPMTANAVLQGDQTGAELGNRVSSAGDVNGDGYSDVIVGADQYDSGETNEGAAFVFHGGPTGIASGNPATANAVLESNQANASFGWSVSGAGDVNGDGYADVIVGAYLYDSGQTNEGAAFVFHGGASGVASGNPATANAVVQSNQAFANLGNSVSSAGDVNGDSYADVIVGALFYSSGEDSEGAAFIFEGGPTGIQGGNPATANTVLESNQISGALGQFVAGAGDVNGDSYADVIVGAVGYSSGETNEGAAFVYHGGPTGIANGNPGTANATFEANQANSGLGIGVAGAGDVNGDGFADVVVGASQYDAGETDEGAAFVLLSGDGQGRPVLARQLRGNDDTTGVEPWGSSLDAAEFQVRMTATHPDGRGRVRLQIEAAPAGEPWGGPNSVIAESPTFADVTATAGGVTLTRTVSGLASDTLYRWRARILTAPFTFSAIPPHPMHGPWRRVRGQAVEADIRTAMGQPCMLSCPGNITALADAGQCSAVVMFSPSTMGSCGTVACVPASGSAFPVGVTTVTCSEAGGAMCSFTVTVNDTQAPSVACPANIALFAHTGAGAVVAYTTPSAMDNCPGANVMCSPAPGALFPVGVTTVTCTATDAAANSTQCTFTITVTLPNDSVGVVNASGAWFLNNGIGSGPADVTYFFGLGTDVPVAGDWNGDGVDTAGVYRPSTSEYRLKNTHGNGGADVVFQFGAPGFGFVPVVGDWNGDGVTTPGLYQPSTGAFFIKNTNAAGDADLIFFFGPSGLNLVPIVGDWDGDGTDGVGLYDPAIGSWQLKNTVGNGGADVVFFFGSGGLGYVPVVGDWNNDGVDGVGVYLPSSGAVFLRNGLSSGPADALYFFGPANATPRAGNWDGLP